MTRLQLRLDWLEVRLHEIKQNDRARTMSDIQHLMSDRQDKIYFPNCLNHWVKRDIELSIVWGALKINVMVGDSVT